MRVFAMLVGGEETPSARERVLKHLPALAARGIEMRVHVAGALRPGLLGKLQYVERLVREAARADAVLLHRMLLTAKELALLTRANRRIVYDFDDALWLAQPGVPPDRGAASRLASALRVSRIVLAGNAVLAEHARQFAGTVEIAPTCIDLERYAVRSPRFPVAGRKPGARSPQPAGGTPDTGRGTDNVVFGWIGLGVNLRSLEAIGEPLRRVCEQVPGAWVKVICDRAPEMPGVPVRFAAWRRETEAEELREADIGLMPLADEPWSRGKCAWKALQYMALAIPPVVSPVGANRDVVRDGECGRWASTAEEWVRALADLAGDAGLRNRLGAAARRRVEQDYSAAQAVERLAGALTRAASGA